MSKTEDFLTKEEEQKVVEAIRTAEIATSGEIRVHLESNLTKDCLEHAKEIFFALEMDKTKDKNGVLFYVAITSHQFAVIGDAGIDKVVPNNFWESIKNAVTSEFSKGNNVEGLVQGILEAGEKLKQFFPYQQEDENELLDDISKG